MTQQPPLEISDLLRLRLITDVQISPDGERVAFVLRRMDESVDDYVGNIHVVDRQGMVVQYTSGDNDSAPRWSPDGQYLAFVSKRKDKAQIYLMSTGGGESVPLTDLPLGAGVPYWSPDSSHIVFVAQVSTGTGKEPKNGVLPARVATRTSFKLDGAGFIGDRRRHLFLIDVDKRQVRQLTDGDWHDDNPAWAPDSQSLAFVSNRSDRWDVSLEKNIYILPLGEGEARQITSGSGFNFPVFSPDGRRLAFSGNTDPNEFLVAPSRVFTVDITGGEPGDELGEWDGNPGAQVISDVVNIDEPFHPALRWRPEGLYFLGTERGVSSLYRIDAGRVDNLTPGRHTITGYSISADGTIAAGCADGTHLVDVVLWRDGRSERLTDENAWLEEKHLPGPERVCFEGADGETNEGWLIPPHGHESGRHPAILYVHGGPQLAHGEAFFFEYQLLAAQGFGVFLPNIHGSASYGRAYQLSIRGDWGNRDYQDVLAAAEVLKAQSWADPGRVGIAGGSYGGYMTNWVITHGNQFQAAVTERCCSNLISFMGTSDNGWMWNRQFRFYPEDNVEHLWNMSPMKYVAAARTPTLVIHAENDDRCPLEQGEQMFNALRRLGNETEFVVFPDESHNLSRLGKPSHRVERQDRILEWFRRYLERSSGASSG